MARKNPLKNWLSVRQFAQHFRRSKTHISEFIKNGDIEAGVIDGREYIHKSQLLIYSKRFNRTKFENVAPGHYKVTPARGRKPKETKI